MTAAKRRRDEPFIVVLLPHKSVKTTELDKKSARCSGPRLAGVRAWIGAGRCPALAVRALAWRSGVRRYSVCAQCAQGPGVSAQQTTLLGPWNTTHGRMKTKQVRHSLSGSVELLGLVTQLSSLMSSLRTADRSFFRPPRCPLGWAGLTGEGGRPGQVRADDA